MTKLQFDVVSQGSKTIEITRLIVAGWVGRDRAAVDHHIQELAALGVKPPSNVPCFYPLAASLLTTDPVIQVPRRDSSGEVEVVLVGGDDNLYVGIGSDHTDRKVEAYDVTVSKQMCAKPLSRQLWRFAEVANHWDRLESRCYRTRRGERALYQQGTVATLMHPLDLMTRLTGSSTLPAGTAMFCGTHSVIGELGHGDVFEMELHDPVLMRTVSHTYQLDCLEVAP